MEIVCLDLEGVLVPEIWIAFAEATNIPEFRKTTRDEPDYDKLMHYRIDLLKKHGLGIKEIESTIEKIEPLEGAKEFLDKLRERTQVVIISDTFYEFGRGLMKKLGYPTLMCNKLVVNPNGEIVDYRLRCEKTKLTTVKSLQACGFTTIAAGDSYNDLQMIRASKGGCLFRAPEKIRLDNPDLKAVDTYEEFYDTLTGFLV
jgi:phosphoserine/homoserine phosphotransferase